MPLHDLPLHPVDPLGVAPGDVPVVGDGVGPVGPGGPAGDFGPEGAVGPAGLDGLGGPGLGMNLLDRTKDYRAEAERYFAMRLISAETQNDPI